MTKISLLTLCFFSALSLATQENWLIVPGKSVGPITAKTTHAQLKKQYGPNVSTMDVPLGEDITEKGTVLFPNSPKRKLTITWKNSNPLKNPKQIRINGPSSKWKTREGISTGSTLKQLEVLNGQPFKLTGFEWDHGGTLCGWENGELERILKWPPSGRFLPRLGIENYQDKRLRKHLDKVSGDTCFSSNSKAMQQLNPEIYEILIEF